jgi:hypothetical protein
MSESGVDPDPSTTLTTSTATDTGSSTDVVDGSSEDGSTSDYVCECPPNVPIEFGDALERGFTPADAIAEFDGAALAFEWIGYPEQAPTTLHLGVAYAGGVVEQGPGGSDNCGFISSPCPDGIVMEVTLELSTDDGWLIWSVPAELTGVLGDSFGAALSVQADANVGESSGSLAMQPLFDEDEPVTVETLHFSAGRYELDGEVQTAASLVGSLTDDGGILDLGATPSPFR